VKFWVVVIFVFNIICWSTIKQATIASCLARAASSISTACGSIGTYSRPVASLLSLYRSSVTTTSQFSSTPDSIKTVNKNQSVLKRCGVKSLNVESSVRASGIFLTASRGSSKMASGQDETIYQFKANTIDGEEVSLARYRGNVCLVVNVASKWGLTALNYTQLSALYPKYKDQGFRVLAFPCNQFGGQEPGTEADIKEFVKQYNVTFDMFSKINVNGNNAHPLYKFLKEKQGGTILDAIKWNFTKFLVDRKGVPVKRYGPKTAPNEIVGDIEELLNQEA